MTQIFKRPIEAPATHAFVIGVGAYPDAKPKRGVKSALRAVKDLPSAADSAKLMCDWLIANKDRLEAPLASLEVLISDVPGGNDRYEWVNRPPDGAPGVDEAVSDTVRDAGERWITELTAQDGDVAFFYACGHGAGQSTQPVIFLSDLNRAPGNPWAHHNIGMTASALRQIDSLRAAFFFADTCREFIPKFALATPQDMSRFIVYDPFEGGRDKVALQCAASEALLAYEGPLADSKVLIGRFTQTLLKGLDGASARYRSGKWVVSPGPLFEDMKMLQRVYRPDWRGQPFEPSQAMTQNEVFPIVRHEQPLLPVLIVTDPEDASDRFDLRICESASGQEPWLVTRPNRSTGPWLAHVEGRVQPLYAIADDPPACHASLFVPQGPNFDQRIPVS